MHNYSQDKITREKGTCLCFPSALSKGEFNIFFLCRKYRERDLYLHIAGCIDSCFSLWDLQCTDFLRCRDSGVVGQFPLSPGHDAEPMSGHHSPKSSACLDCSRILRWERNSREKRAGIRGQTATKSFQNFLCLLLLMCFTPRKREYSPQAPYTLQCETTTDSF